MTEPPSIQGNLTALARLRFVAIPLVVGWVTLLVVHGAAWWRFSLVLLIAGPMGVTIHWIQQGRALRRGWFIGAILLGQGVLILITGGIDSPAVAALVASSVLVTLAVGGIRRAAPFLAGAAGLLLGMAALEGSGGGFGLDFLGRRPPVAHWASAVTVALLVIGAGLVGDTVGQALISSERRATAFQGEALSMMRSRNEELVLLSGALAHELKNPLAAIQGLTTYMAGEVQPDSPEAEQLSVVVAEVHRMTDIVSSFLNFSRPLAPERLSEVALEPLVQALVLLHTGLAQAKGIALRVQVPAELGARCDARKVQQCLVNLLQNALAFGPTGGPVILSGERMGGQVFVYVDDEGPGVPEAQREAVFEPGVTTRDTGSGMGLAIARRMARAHGGEVLIRTAPGGGCRGCLRLPANGPSESNVEGAA